MEEFVENFNQFRDWLYDAVECAEYNSDDERVLNKVIQKFEEYDLNNAF